MCRRSCWSSVVGLVIAVAIVFGLSMPAAAQCFGNRCVMVSPSQVVVSQQHVIRPDVVTVVKDCCDINGCPITDVCVQVDRHVLPDTVTRVVQSSGGVSVARSSSGGYAQRKAEQMARGRFTHNVPGFGMAGRYEGIGMSSSSPEAAIRACCYWGRRTAVDIGVAYSAHRRAWVAVVGYQ